MDIFATITKGYYRPYSINNTNQSNCTLLTRYGILDYSIKLNYVTYA